jgi:hypothetical protein
MTYVTITHFLLSEWIWSISWGVHHQLFNIACLSLLFKIFLRIPMVYALFTACTIQICSFILFCTCAAGSMYTIGTGLGPDGYCCVPNAVHAALYLGIINTVMNSTFALLIFRKKPIRTSWILTIILLSNSITILMLAFVFPPQL